MKPIQFLLLAILLSLLIVNTESGLVNWLMNMVFLFLSFLVFRFLDDAGSVHVDRVNHPERIYLTEDKYSKFLLWTTFILVLYLAVNFIIEINRFYVLSILIFASIIGYLLFGKKEKFLSLIPLIKYPVLLWCLAVYTNDLDTLAIISSSFFIMFIYDRLDISSEELKGKWIVIGATMICGILAFTPWNGPISYLYILIAVGVIIFLDKWKYIKFFSIIYYPLMVLIQSLY